MDKLTAIAENGYNQRIFVRGDTQANYGKVMEVMGLLGRFRFHPYRAGDRCRQAKAQPAIRRRRAAIPRRLRPTTARGPRYGVALSALFHALIFMAALFSFHRNFETPPDSQFVPVDLVTIADQTNIAGSVSAHAADRDRWSGRSRRRWRRRPSRK